MIENHRPGSEAQPLNRRDNISPISLVLLLALLIWQISPLSTIIEKRLIHIKPLLHKTAPIKTADADSLITLDISAKWSYVANLLPRHYRTPADNKLKLEAANSAIDALRKTPLDPSIARRVILLRAEVGDTRPLDAMPAHGKTKAAPAPILAFGRPEFAGEKALWTELFSIAPATVNDAPALHDSPPASVAPAYTAIPAARPAPAKPAPAPAVTHAAPAAAIPHFTPAQTARLKREIYAAPNLRWYRYLALHQLYLRSGDSAAAVREVALGAAAASKSLLPVLLIEVGMVVAGLVGIVLLMALLTRPRQGGLTNAQGLPEPPPDTSGQMWPDLLEPLGARRMGAGDLFDIFVAYMFIFEAASLGVQGGFAAWAAHHRAYFAAHEADIIVWVQATHQVTTGILSIGLLQIAAKSRGSNLAREVWMRLGSGWSNVGYGMAGWAISLPLLLVSSWIASLVLKGLPNPSNPAIEMIAVSSSVVSRLVLFAMVCVIAPIVEETMFRGVFYQAARAKLGIWPAIVLTGVVFGSIHPVGLAGTVPLMVLGGVLAWTAEKRKSLFPGMVCHCLQNSSTFITLIALYQ